MSEEKTAKTESRYTEEVLTEMRANVPLDWEKAQEIAKKFDLPPMGVVNSAKRNKIEYKRKERVSKTGAKVISKAELVAQIAEKFSKTIEGLDGLDKATKSALEYLVK